MYVAVLNTQKSVLQEDAEKLRKELHEGTKFCFWSLLINRRNCVRLDTGRAVRRMIYEVLTSMEVTQPHSLVVDFSRQKHFPFNWCCCLHQLRIDTCSTLCSVSLASLLSEVSSAFGVYITCQTAAMVITMGPVENKHWKLEKIDFPVDWEDRRQEEGWVTRQREAEDEEDVRIYRTGWGIHSHSPSTWEKWFTWYSRQPVMVFFNQTRKTPVPSTKLLGF